MFLDISRKFVSQLALFARLGLASIENFEELYDVGPYNPSNEKTPNFHRKLLVRFESYAWPIPILPLCKLSSLRMDITRSRKLTTIPITSAAARTVGPILSSKPA